MGELKSLVEEGVVEVDSDLHKITLKLINFRGDLSWVDYNRAMIAALKLAQSLFISI